MFGNMYTNILRKIVITYVIKKILEVHNIMINYISKPALKYTKIAQSNYLKHFFV